jgi:response regulator RpfG family c-di-GMP phosphodiesterase
VSLGLDNTEIEQVAMAAVPARHIGKVAVPDRILHKPAALDAEEWLLMREHPVHRRAHPAGHPAAWAPWPRIVRHEHERYDGAATPTAWRAATSRSAACIILACDAYSAMTTDRPLPAPRCRAAAALRGALPLRRATQFDPSGHRGAGRLPVLAGPRGPRRRRRA